MKNSEKTMDAARKEALKAAKEISVKFIETGRISTANFADIFPSIYSVVLNSILGEPCAASEKSPAGKENNRS